MDRLRRERQRAMKSALSKKTVALILALVLRFAALLNNAVHSARLSLAAGVIGTLALVQPQALGSPPYGTIHRTRGNG